MNEALLLKYNVRPHVYISFYICSLLFMCYKENMIAGTRFL